MKDLNFITQKRINIILYILNKYEERTIDFITLLKVIYFAEQKHLALYGHQITDDNFIKMQFGPVASGIFDILKEARNNKSYDNYFKVFNTHLVRSVSGTDEDYLSELERKSLDDSFDEHKRYSPFELSDISHDKAWLNASMNKSIDIIEIAKAANTSPDLIHYIQFHREPVQI